MTKTVLQAKLLPCPFCASVDVELRESVSDEMIACCDCGARTGIIRLGPCDAVNAAERRNLIAAWNRRDHAEQARIEERERGKPLREAADAMLYAFAEGVDWTPEKKTAFHSLAIAIRKGVA